MCSSSLFPVIFLLFFFSSSVVPGFCLPSGMVAPHLTACMRNDKMGEASVPQNQTTVCNCPPPMSGSLFRFPSPLLSVSPLYHPDPCVAWPRVIRSMHTNPFTQKSIASAAAAVAAVIGFALVRSNILSDSLASATDQRQEVFHVVAMDRKDR